MEEVMPTSYVPDRQMNYVNASSVLPSPSMKPGISYAQETQPASYAPPRSDGIFTRPVLIGAGVGFLARGVTGAVIGAILGSFWKR